MSWASCRAGLGPCPLDSSRATETALASSTAYMSADMPSKAMLLPLPPANYRLVATAEAAHFIPFSTSPTADMPTFVRLPHHSLASQQSTDSAATVINSQHHLVMPHCTGAAAGLQQGSIACCSLPLPTTAVATSAHQQQQQQLSQAQAGPAVLPAKKTSKGKKGSAATADQEAAMQAAANVPGSAGGGGGAGGGATAEGAPVKRKRGPYKKRVKKDGEEKVVKPRKKKAMTMMPALQAFAKGIQPQAGPPRQQPHLAAADSEQGPSKRARCGPASVGTACHLHPHDTSPLGSPSVASQLQGLSQQTCAW